MATINTSYGNYALLRTVAIAYNDVSHTIINGMVTTTVIPSGLGAGVEFYKQQGIGEYWSLRVQNTAPYAYVVHVVESGGGGGSGLADDLNITSLVKIDEWSGSKGRITVNATGSGTKRYSINGKPVQASNLFTGLSAGTYTIKLSRLEDGTYRTQAITLYLIADPTITLTSTNATSIGANDGKITVNVTGGRLNLTYKFYKGDGTLVNTVFISARTKTYINLVPDTYTIEITDANGVKVSSSATISEPVVIPDPTLPESYSGTIFEVPFINSLTFVKDGLDGEEQGLDNRLLCKQEFKNITDNRYFQKLNKTDKPTIQFISNYQNHFVELYNYKTDELISSFSIDTKEDNISTTVQYGITLRTDVAGRSRVYFNTPIIPLPFYIGQSFLIEANVNFNGQYVITDIQTDQTLGFQYLVITKAYPVGPASQLATGEFVNPIGYNVYESTLILDTLPEGFYYAKISAFSPVQTSFTSEPIHLKTKHTGVCTIVYANEANAYDIIFSTGYRGFVRVPALFGHKRFPGGERTMSRNSNYSLVKVSSKKQRLIEFETFEMPPYMHEKLSVIFDLDIFSVNGVPCQTSEGYEKPQYVDKSVIADSSIVLEQLNWFGNYNSSNLMGTVTSSGCLCDEIDLIAVSSSIASIVLNMNNKKQRIFALQPDITDDKELVLSNDTAGLSLSATFTMVADKILTLPDNFRILNNNDWDNSTKEWLCSTGGKYRIQMTMDGNEWVGVIVGP